MKNFWRLMLISFLIAVPSMHAASEPAAAEQAAETGNTACPICLAEYEETDASFTLPCRHRFHHGCIRQWVVDHRKNNCPTCREPVHTTTHQLLSAARADAAEARLATAICENNLAQLNQAIADHANIHLPLFFIHVPRPAASRIPLGTVVGAGVQSASNPLTGEHLPYHILILITNSHRQVEGDATFLMLAARLSTPTIITRLIDAGSNLESSDENGQTALGYAIQADKLDNVEALLESGAACSWLEKARIQKLRLANFYRNADNLKKALVLTAPVALAMTVALQEYAIPGSTQMLITAARQTATQAWQTVQDAFMGA